MYTNIDDANTDSCETDDLPDQRHDVASQANNNYQQAASSQTIYSIPVAEEGSVEPGTMPTNVYSPLAHNRTQPQSQHQQQQQQNYDHLNRPHEFRFFDTDSTPQQQQQQQQQYDDFFSAAAAAGNSVSNQQPYDALILSDATRAGGRAARQRDSVTSASSVNYDHLSRPYDVLSHGPSHGHDPASSPAEGSTSYDRLSGHYNALGDQYHLPGSNSTRQAPSAALYEVKPITASKYSGNHNTKNNNNFNSNSDNSDHPNSYEKVSATPKRPMTLYAVTEPADTTDPNGYEKVSATPKRPMTLYAVTEPADNNVPSDYERASATPKRPMTLYAVTEPSDNSGPNSYERASATPAKPVALYAVTEPSPAAAVAAAAQGNIYSQPDSKSTHQSTAYENDGTPPPTMTIDFGSFEDRAAVNGASLKRKGKGSNKHRLRRVLK